MRHWAPFRAALGTGGVALLVAAPLAVRAQATTLPATALPARLGAPARDSIERIADTLRAAGVPPTPLYDKAAEGLLKNAPDARIVVVVRSLAHDLLQVRGTLGPSASLNDLMSAASALHAGVPLPAIERLRAKPGAPPLALSYIVLADLVTRGVPASTAVSSVETLLAHGAGDAELSAFRTGVERDLLAGRDPAASTAARAHGITRQLDPRGQGVP